METNNTENSSTLTNAQNALLTKKNDIPFFADLTNEEVLRVTEGVEFIRLKKRDQIFDQGDLSRSIYYVVRGSVEIEIKKINDDGEEEFVPVATLQKRAFFGEMAFITGDPRTARAVSAEDETTILTFRILNDVESNDISTIRTLALVYFYFAQDLAQKLKTTSANYAKIKTVDDINYDDLLDLINSLKMKIIEHTQNSNVLSIEKEILEEINGFFPLSYDPVTQKEVIKTALSESFVLNEKDLIIFAKDRVVIRLFREQLAPVELPQEEKTIETIVEDQEAVEYVKSLFSSREQFEIEVLGCNGVECEKSIVRAFENILEKMPQQKHLSFLHMISYSHFRLSKAVEALELYLTQALKMFFINSCALSDFKAKEIVSTEESIAFIRKISLEYTKTYRPDLTKMIADSFIESLNKDVVPDVVIEAMKGTFEYKPILSKPDGGFVAANAEQIKIRITQALKERERRIADTRVDYEKAKTMYISAKKQLEAFDVAKMVSLEKINSYDYKQLRDIVINEDNQFDDQKRILAFIPSGEKTLALKEMSDRGVRSATNEVQKEEYQRTYRFFNAVHDNNTEKALEQKKINLKERMVKLGVQQERLRETLNLALNRRLEEFDDGLRKIYDAIVTNLGKKI